MRIKLLIKTICLGVFIPCISFAVKPVFMIEKLPPSPFNPNVVSFYISNNTSLPLKNNIIIPNFPAGITKNLMNVDCPIGFNLPANSPLGCYYTVNVDYALIKQPIRWAPVVCNSADSPTICNTASPEQMLVVNPQ